MVNCRINKGVILAAGAGTRLGSLTRTCPKVLLPMSNKEPLITYPIRALAAAGIRGIAVVVGYLGDKVMQALGDGSALGVELHYLANPDYLGGNAISACKAEQWAKGEPVVLCMGDHAIEGKLIRQLLDSETLNDTLCIDHRPAQYHRIDEATKVAVSGTGCIKDIGKELVRWDALDTGAFLVTKNFFEAIYELVQCRGIAIETADVIRFLIGKGHDFHTCDVSGCFWMDVDTQEDLKAVRW